MRKSEFEIKDKKIIDDILKNAEYATFAFCMDNKPYSLPINFVHEEDKIYFHGSKKGKKKDYILANANAALSITEPLSVIQSYFSSSDGKACPATHFFRSLCAEGEIKIVDTYDEKVKALELLMKKLQPEGKYIPLNKEEVYKKMINATEVFRFDINDIKGKVKLGQHLPADRFEMIINYLNKRGYDIDKKTIEMMNQHKVKQKNY